MVEGHSVHRVVHRLRQQLQGKVVKATSPNGRFREGAAKINLKRFESIEAHGKNIFAFFGQDSEETCVHVHFGMSGVWSIFTQAEDEPEPRDTTRLRLETIGEGPKLSSQLSAMTVAHGSREDLYEKKRKALGQDPLRNDADIELLWNKVHTSSKGIGALIMDQSFFAGPGNIYRAEILFCAGVHPSRLGRDLTRNEFDRIWAQCVLQLRRGYDTGSIITVDKQEAVAVGQPKLRRWIYNTAQCPKCQTRIVKWDIATRTCYACPTCQPMTTQDKSVDSQQVEPFISHCAPDTIEERLLRGGPALLTVAELKVQLRDRNAPLAGKKADLVSRLAALLNTNQEPATAEQAAIEKIQAGENRAVEHVADIHPTQAKRLRENIHAIVHPVTPTNSSEASTQGKSTTKRRRRASPRFDASAEEV